MRDRKVFRILFFLFIFSFLFCCTLSSPVNADETYVFSTKWGSFGTGNGQFLNIADVAVDSSGNVYVVDRSLGIQKFSSNGTFITKWGSQGNGDGQFISGPVGVAADSSGNVYVAENSRIQKFVRLTTPVEMKGIRAR